MKFTCNRDDLIEGINIVQKAVPSKSNLPILEGILIEVGEELKLTGNDNDICIEYEVPAIIEEIGKIVVLSKTFGDIIRKMPDVYVSIETNNEGNGIKVSSGNSVYNLKIMPADTYPKPPVIENTYDICIPEKQLVSMIKQTIFATSPEDKRIVLRGIYVEQKDSHMNFVALDGFRLALKSIVREDTTDFDVIVPSRVMSELSKILQNGDEPINFRTNGSQILFYNEKLNITSKLYKGEYINYKKMFPPEFVTKVTVNNKMLMSAIERASLMINDDKKYSINIELMRDPEKIIITSNAENGSSREIIPAVIEGKEMVLAFYPKSILDCLKVTVDENIELSFTSEVGPCVIKGEEDDSFRYLMMPVKIQR